MRDDLTSFGKFYREKHQGHKLEWDHALGTVTMRASFKDGVKELSVSLYQAVVLLLFNDVSEMPLQEIQENTRLGAHGSDAYSPCFVTNLPTLLGRGRGAAAHATEPGMRQEEGAAEAARGQGRERRGRIRVQRRVHGLAGQGAHQHHPGQGNGASPIRVSSPLSVATTSC